MMNNPFERPTIKGPGNIRRKAVNMSQEGLIKEDFLSASTTLPLVIKPSVEGMDLADWAAGNRNIIDAYLLKYGGILFRNFKISDTVAVDEFHRFLRVTSSQSMDYLEGASPRTRISGNIYTSTDYPADQTIFLHNELAYRLEFPMKIYFFCVIAPMEGGETPIADVRKVFQRIHPRVRERFIQKGWMLVRNYGDGFGLPWQKVFHTEKKAEVEAYCYNNDIHFAWKEQDQLRIWQVRRTVARHPYTHEMVWFNHVAFFHISTREASIRDALLKEYDEEDLPTNTYYGDGTPIEPEVLQELREAHQQETILFPWQEGDLLLLDNVSVAHGRSSFTGERKVLVGMADPYKWEDIEI